MAETGIFELDGEYVFASYLIRLKVNNNLISPFFLTQYLNLPIIQYRLKAYATPGVSQANINPGSLKSFPLVLPPIEEIYKIDSLLRKCDEVISSIQRQNETAQQLLDDLKNSIFHKV